MIRSVEFYGQKYYVDDIYKYVARDSNGEVYAYVNKPRREAVSDFNHKYIYYDQSHGIRKYLGNTECVEIVDSE